MSDTETSQKISAQSERIAKLETKFAMGGILIGVLSVFLFGMNVFGISSKIAESIFDYQNKSIISNFRGQLDEAKELAENFGAIRSEIRGISSSILPQREVCEFSGGRTENSNILCEVKCDENYVVSSSSCYVEGVGNDYDRPYLHSQRIIRVTAADGLPSQHGVRCEWLRPAQGSIVGWKDDAWGGRDQVNGIRVRTVVPPYGSYSTSPTVSRPAARVVAMALCVPQAQ